MCSHDVRAVDLVLLILREQEHCERFDKEDGIQYHCWFVLRYK